MKTLWQCYVFMTVCQIVVNVAPLFAYMTGRYPAPDQLLENCIAVNLVSASLGVIWIHCALLARHMIMDAPEVTR